MRHLMLIVCLGFTACETEITPLVEDSRPFTLYGYLNPTQNLQILRVIPITQRIDAPVENPIDAVVTSTNLTNGQVQPSAGIHPVF